LAHKNHSRIALGTAQFGLDYGISNFDGKVSEKEVAAILTLTNEQSVSVVDTASVYGESEAVLGKFLPDTVEVVTKATFSADAVGNVVQNGAVSLSNSLRLLKRKRVFGWLAHDAEKFANDRKNIQQWMVSADQAIANNEVTKTGVSVYTPEALSKILDNARVDLVQIPLAPIDSRWESTLERLATLNIEVHVRSIFLQGLLLLEKLPPHQYFQNWLEYFDKWVEFRGVDAASVCIGATLSDPRISKVIFGVTSASQFSENLKCATRPHATIPERLKMNDQRFLDPSLWPAK
jgi:aryl-alcohol dehydrogenase-like predicted oxidoreductase